MERATRLAETRWPGSGQMVALANDWARLTPAARRERLATIGPADLARPRRLADVQPDPARVLYDLERPGVLPPAQELETTTETREELLVDAAMRAGQAAMRDVAEREHARQATRSGAAPAVVLDAPAPLAQVDWPALDLGRPTSDEVLAVEAERRYAVAEAAEAALERVRARGTVARPLVRADKGPCRSCARGGGRCAIRGTASGGRAGGGAAARAALCPGGCRGARRGARQRGRRAV